MSSIIEKILVYGLVEIVLLLCVPLFAGLFAMSIGKPWFAFLFFLLAVVAVVFAFGIFPRYALRKLREED